METRWLYVTSEEFTSLREASCDTCIIPIGCVEKHGLHLPLGTDIMHSNHIAWMASQIETVCVFPDFIFGDVPGHNPPPGTVTIPLETQLLLLEQLCEQMARNGFKKIILYNGHGGNNLWLSAFLRNIENKPHDYVAVKVTLPGKVISTFGEKLLAEGIGSIPELTKEDEELLLGYYKGDYKEGGHGGFGETAYMMGVYPETVKMDRLGIVSGEYLGFGDPYKAAGIELRDAGWDISYPNSYSGDDPIGCNERIGKAAVRLEAERLAKAIKFLKEDTELIKYHNLRWETNI